MEKGTNPEVVSNPYPFYGKIINEHYGYLSMDGFVGGDSISANNYTDSLQRIVAYLADQKPKGWIIDLRHNDGGWPYPMIAGVGPILGSGVKAYTLALDEPPLEYYYAKNNTDYLALTDSVWFCQAQLPTVILIGHGTGSAAELLTLAFRGNPNTALIGEPTYGVSTGIRGCMMPDSMQLSITNSIMTDRYQEGNGGPIQPDIFCATAADAFEKAYAWIDSKQ